MDSILTSIKKLLGITEDNKDFDIDIIMFINDAFVVLSQLGVGPAEGFSIIDEDNTWDEFAVDPTIKEMVKTYIYLKVRMIFNPPDSSTVLSAINERIRECEWRLNIQVDPIIDRNREEEIQNG